MSIEPGDKLRFGNARAGIVYLDRPAAYAVITDGDGRVAAVLGTRGYFLPGGGSLPDEPPEETIRREAVEELARTVRLLLKIGEVVQYFSAGEEHYRMRAVFYAAEFTGAHESKAEYDLAWLTLKEAEESFFHKCHVWAVRQSKLL